jgi:AraC-like DNA-binding protein
MRGGAVALLLLFAVLLVRDARRVVAANFAALFALGAACYTIVSASMFAEAAPPPWLLPLQIAAMGNPVIFWLFAATLFDDDFKPSWVHAAAWLVLVAFGIFGLWSGVAWGRWICSGLGLACNALGVWYALAGRALDLVEERRKLRAVLVIAIALYAAANIISELAVSPGGGKAALSLVNAAGLLAITSVFAVVLLTVSRDGALISIPASEPAMQPVQPRRVASGIGHDERASADDARQLAELRNLMENDKAYREEGLSIGTLAGKLGMPEHGLRRLINRRLGYRNFNAFLNGYRLDDVMGALADPSQESVPILTIALDAGFQSLGPFNRAFKAKCGMTPTEYRREQLGRSDRIAAE